MSHKLFLPLVITAFVASAAAANTPATTHSSSSRIVTQCANSRQLTGYSRASSPDALADTAIGQVSGLHGAMASTRELFVASQPEGRSFRPYMVAALEMAASPAPDGTPTSCYPALSLATTSVPPATAGASYSVSLAANGGQPPYTWSFGQSSLPQGFSISSSGDLTGTPSAAGTYTFNVVLSDSLKSNVTGALTLTVAANNTVPPPTQPPPTQPPPTQPPPTQPPPTQPPPTQPPPTQPPPTQPPPTQPPPTQPPPTQPPPTQPPPTQPPPTQPPPTQPPPTQPPPTQPPPTQPPPTQPPPTQPPPTQPPPTQPPPTQPPTGPAKGTALTSCGDITKGGSYYLANDVSSGGTCFGIDADGITLNLNGHTITYGTGGGDVSTPAIEGHDCWSTTNPAINGPCGSTHGGLEVYGGAIIQSPNSAPFSPVFSFGEGTFSSAPYIHNVTATFQSTGAQFYNSNYVPAGARIENNVIYDNVTNIQKPGQVPLSARSAFQGQAIYIGQNSNNPGSGDQIENNTIVGSPQGGVRTVNQHSVISGNDISMNASYANDFCADIPADYTTVSNNNCHPLSGRGFHANANHDQVTGNAIRVIELKQDPEYGGCEGGGTYGVQIEWDTSILPNGPPAGVQVTGNTITATAGDCNAAGLRVTDLTSAANVTISGNTVTTTNNGGVGQDFGFSTDGSNNSGVTITGNTIQSKYAYADGEWDGFSNTMIGHNTWLGTPKYTFVATDGGCDPSVMEAGAVCPANFQFSDTLPNTVSCGASSEANVRIAGQVTQCKAAQ